MRVQQNFKINFLENQVRNEKILFHIVDSFFHRESTFPPVSPILSAAPCVPQTYLALKIHFKHIRSLLYMTGAFEASQHIASHIRGGGREENVARSGTLSASYTGPYYRSFNEMVSY